MKWALGFSLFLVGCGHMETHAALLRPAEAPKTDPVEIYIADQASPQRPYYELALVQAIGFGADANAEDVVHALTDRAAAQGCDAVVRTYIDIGYSRAHAAGVCVRWLGAGPAAPTPILPGRPKSLPVRVEPTPKIEPLPSAPNQGR